MVEGAPDEARDFVEPWMKIAEPVLRGRPEGQATAQMLTHYETEVVRLSLAHLRTFPWIDEAVLAGRLRLTGYRFDIHTGALVKLEHGPFAFISVDRSCVEPEPIMRSVGMLETRLDLPSDLVAVLGMGSLSAAGPRAGPASGER